VDKIGGLDQYGPERFGRLIFVAIGKKCGNETLKDTLIQYYSSS